MNLLGIGGNAAGGADKVVDGEVAGAAGKTANGMMAGMTPDQQSQFSKVFAQIAMQPYQNAMSELEEAFQETDEEG
jgi:ABC-type transporter MlaC component